LVDQTGKKEAEAERAAIKLAQKSTHETQIALAAAPPSRPVVVASGSAATASALLDQAVGPLPTAELSNLRETVTGLLSEDPKVSAGEDAGTN